MRTSGRSISPEVHTTLPEMPPLERLFGGEDGWSSLGELARELDWSAGIEADMARGIIDGLASGADGDVLRAVADVIDGELVDEDGRPLRATALAVVYPTARDAFREPLVFARLTP